MLRSTVPGSLVCHVELPFVITVAETFQSVWVFENGLSALVVILRRSNFHREGKIRVIVISGNRYYLTHIVTATLFKLDVIHLACDWKF